MSKDLVSFIQDLYGTNGRIPLHEPFFDDRDKELLIETVDSTFVSSAGPLISDFEKKIAEYTGSKYSIAVVNGTAALQISLELSGVNSGDDVITQSLTFVASVNAILQCRASPIFIDVDKETLGMSPESLKNFLEEHCEIREKGCWNKKSRNYIKACLPMHTFGFPCEVEKLKTLCRKYKIKLIEDAAESIGSFVKKKHTGLFGDFGILSFNGNKIITTGAGGMLLTNNKKNAQLAKHITTTAKLPHKWNFDHDIPAYNYRMPNLNASLGITQFEKLPFLLKEKRRIANHYKDWGNHNGYYVKDESRNTTSNFWLNTLIAENKKQRDEILEDTNKALIMTRPSWTPMHKLPFNKKFQKGSLKNTNWLADRIVNLPSSARNVKN
tara:strand:+ start:25662 stop:26810 length:1149 start_codon:yes stop_codon:yes gene_type:complete